MKKQPRKRKVKKMPLYRCAVCKEEVTAFQRECHNCGSALQPLDEQMREQPKPTIKQPIQSAVPPKEEEPVKEEKPEKYTSQPIIIKSVDRLGDLIRKSKKKKKINHRRTK